MGDLVKKDRATSLGNLGRDFVRSWGVPGGHFLEGFHHFFSRWGRVEFQVHRSLWKMFNGRVVDRKGAVEDTVKVFGPSLQDLFLLRNQGCSIRSKDVGRPGGLRSVRKQCAGHRKTACCHAGLDSPESRLLRY